MTDVRGWSSFWRLFYANEWEVETHNWIRRTVKTGSLFLDIGAWIGPTALWAQQMGANVIAVEPDPIAFAEMERILGEEPRIEMIEAALTVESGFASLSPNPKEGGMFGDSMSRISGSGQIVVACDLDEILEGRIPDAVKIDIEGYEYELLPHILPRLAEMRCELHVSFHDPDNIPTEWFEDWDWHYLRGLELEAGFIR